MSCSLAHDGILNASCSDVYDATVFEAVRENLEIVFLFGWNSLEKS